MVCKGQCMRCNRSPVLDPGALAHSLEQHINGDLVHLRIATREAILDLRCQAEACQRLPRNAKPTEVYP